jgi:hypothetical protein
MTAKFSPKEICALCFVGLVAALWLFWQPPDNLTLSSGGDTIPATSLSIFAAAETDPYSPSTSMNQLESKFAQAWWWTFIPLILPFGFCAVYFWCRIENRLRGETPISFRECFTFHVKPWHFFLWLVGIILLWRALYLDDLMMAMYAHHCNLTGLP